MTALRQRAHNELDLVPEESMEQVFNIIVSFKKEESKVDCDAVEKGFGILHQYADPSKIPLEEGAFERAMVKKHEADRC